MFRFNVYNIYGGSRVDKDFRLFFTGFFGNIFQTGLTSTYLLIIFNDHKAQIINKIKISIQIN
jgi:hypothetical protein